MEPLLPQAGVFAVGRVQGCLFWSLLSVFEVLGLKLKTSCMPSKCSPQLNSQPEVGLLLLFGFGLPRPTRSQVPHWPQITTELKVTLYSRYS